MNKPVETAWLEYRTKALPPCLHPDGVERVKEAFYAGYYQAMILLEKVGNDTVEGVRTEENNETIYAAVSELEAFRLSKGPHRN